MANNKAIYGRYILSYPYDGQTIHKTRSFKKGVKKCYHDFKQLHDMPDGLFSITNLDNEKEYHFKVQNHRIHALQELKNIKGGNVNERGNIIGRGTGSGTFMINTSPPAPPSMTQLAQPSMTQPAPPSRALPSPPVKESSTVSNNPLYIKAHDAVIKELQEKNKINPNKDTKEKDNPKNNNPKNNNKPSKSTPKSTDKDNQQKLDRPFSKLFKNKSAPKNDFPNESEDLSTNEQKQESDRPIIIQNIIQSSPPPPPKPKPKPNPKPVQSSKCSIDSGMSLMYALDIDKKPTNNLWEPCIWDFGKTCILF